MAKIERHPAPEKLLQQITTETINAMELGGADRIGDVAPLETGVDLIAKAWGLPQDLLDNSLALIQRQKKLVGDGSGKAALPDDELLEPYDGGMIAELVWGLFETAIRLDDAGDRKTIHHLALLLADILDFDEWIEESSPTEK